MINIEATQVITYGNNQTVTVYQDYSDANTHYIVPAPVIPLNDAGIPEFSILEYTDGTATTATVSFQTELQVSAEALAAVKAKLGAGITIGQFDWKSVKSIFHFATATNGALQLTATPSMFGANRASFVIHLPDQPTYEAFVAALGPSGSAGGTFVLEYDVTALTRLPPATVTVDFNSQTAFDYQRTVSVSKDTWGHVTSETVAIQEHLQQSKAGTITVDPGGSELDAATLKRLQAWGNATLANDVTQAVMDARRMMDANTAPTFNMTSVASFHDVYAEGQVVPWIITPRAPIPAFSQSDWDQISSSVSIRPMKVGFTVQDLTANGVSSIDLTVNYPVGSKTPAANNTFSFTPSDQSSWIFKAPGNINGAEFDGTYSYSYVVNYKDGSQPYTSDTISDTQSEIHLTANDLNVLRLEFAADNVPFVGEASTGDLVDHVLVDMFFVNETTGDDIPLQQAKLTSTVKNHTFQSPTHEPFSNPCSYRLTYVLEHGQQVVLDWETTSLAAPVKEGSDGKSQAPSLTIDSPFQSVSISLWPLAPKNHVFEMIALDASYVDHVNDVNEQHSWQIVDTSTPADKWNFLAPINTIGQVVTFSGTYVYDNQQHQLQPTKTSQSMFILNPATPLFTVLVDPSQLEWTTGNFTQVVLTMYTKNGEQKTSVKTFPAFHADNAITPLYSFNYSAKATPTCYYTAEYWVKGQPTPTVIAETAVAAQGQLTLPGAPPAAG